MNLRIGEKHINSKFSGYIRHKTKTFVGGKNIATNSYIIKLIYQYVHISQKSPL